MLTDTLTAKRDLIVKQWSDTVRSSYPAKTAQYLESQADRFHNPVGHDLDEYLPILVDQILGDMNRDELMTALDRIVRIRSVQDFTASEAVSFVFSLKQVVRTVLKKETDLDSVRDELFDLDRRIDALALMAFDLYTNCREKLYEIRHNAMIRETRILLERANLTQDRSQSRGESADDASQQA